MKQRLVMMLVGLCWVVGAVQLTAYAKNEETSIYGEYDSFNELYDAYFEAVENGDVEKQGELLEIAESSLKKEIQASEVAYYLQVKPLSYSSFFDLFSNGYWQVRNGQIDLSLWPREKKYWSEEEKFYGWNLTYDKFSYDPSWDNTECMKEQFYCHARLGYSWLQDEWNLEPWRTSMNAITCN